MLTSLSSVTRATGICLFVLFNWDGLPNPWIHLALGFLAFDSVIATLMFIHKWEGERLLHPHEKRVPEPVVLAEPL